MLLGLEAAAEDDLDARPSHLDVAGEHDHDDFTTFSVEIGEVDGPETLAARIADAVAAHGILRMKGFRRRRGQGHAPPRAGGRGAHPSLLRPEWRDEEPRRSRLVVIGETGLDERRIRETLRAAGG